MIYIITVLVFVFTYIIFNIFIYRLEKDRIHIINRLEKIKKNKNIKNSNELDELEAPLKQRILIPLINSINNFMSKITPNGMQHKIDQKLIMAGKPYNLKSDQWFLIKLIVGLIIPSIINCLIIINSKTIEFKTIFFILIIYLISLYLPDYFLLQIINNRKKEIEKTLPDVLDLLTVSVEAGLSFDSSVNRLTKKMTGVISDEFNRTLHEMKIGKTRREALSNMSTRCNVPDLSIFIGSLIQADELGVGIGSVLRIQSTQMRERRRQRAQEKAMKAPVKILFPLVFFIFPTIFVIILGPSIIRFMELMSK